MMIDDITMNAARPTPVFVTAAPSMKSGTFGTIHNHTPATPIAIATNPGPGPQYQAENAIAGHSIRYGALLWSTGPRERRMVRAIAVARIGSTYRCSAVCSLSSL